MKSGLYISLFLTALWALPASEVCLYVHMNWSLAQAQQQSSLGLSQSFTSMRSGNARPKVGSWFNV